MIQAIRFILSVGCTVTLINTRGCIINVSSVSIGDTGIYNYTGEFYSCTSLMVLQYTIEK